VTQVKCDIAHIIDAITEGLFLERLKAKMDCLSVVKVFGTKSGVN